jgi:hypothetical protein
MKIIVVYVFPMNGAGAYMDLAIRFLTSYHEHPAGLDHEFLVVCNGAPVTDEARFLFDSVPNVRYMQHDNSGYDIGAFQKSARENPCDLMLFFGVTAYIRGPQWLKRVWDSYQKHGDTLYGVMGNRGDGRFRIYPHIRTTGFWMSPALLNKYPHVISRPEQRYGFEHGKECLTSWIKKRGLIPWVVSFSGEYQWEQWDSFPNGFHRGDQSDLIFGDKNSCPPYYPCS